jgi:hypothetical protein
MAPEAWNPEPWYDDLGEIRSVGAEVLGLDPHDVRANLAIVYLDSALELTDGVLAELRKERPTNAVRLARHLYEYEVHLTWLLGLSDAEVERELAPRRAPRGIGLKNKVHALERRGQAGRVEDYDLFYHLASRLSHPDLISLSFHVTEGPDGHATLRQGTADPERARQAMVLCARALGLLIDTASSQLGSPQTARLSALWARIEARGKTERAAGQHERGGSSSRGGGAIQADAPPS